jgi:glycerate dehydrogenase
MQNITILDAHTTNPGDLSWAGLAALGNLEIHDRTPPGLIVERAKTAEILLTNKTVLNRKVLSQLPKLRCISVLATGYNVVDTVAAAEMGITVCNVKGYAADSVAQHVFALLLELVSKVGSQAKSVSEGGWQKADDWTYSLSPTLELAGKTMGTYGFGQIGQRVAEIALAFGMKVISTHKHPTRDSRPGVRFVPFEEMLAESDVVSLNSPLTPDNQGIINKNTLSIMKPSAYLINTGRGGLVVENDLKAALENGQLAGAGLDVLSEEPPRNGNVLIGLKNCIITPHIAWATQEARRALIAETVENVRAFLTGRPRNVVG